MRRLNPSLYSTVDSQSRDFQGNTDKWRRFVVLAGEEIQRKAPTHEADFEEDEMDVYVGIEGVNIKPDSSIALEEILVNGKYRLTLNIKPS